MTIKIHMKIDQLENKKILILGYGKEGKVTEQFLKKMVPSAKVTIGDQEKDPNYLSKQRDADLVIKTPSIAKELVTVPYTTATNLFFANNTNCKIGVTGSKGKSTTSSLIYSILKESGRKVELVGNIGNPMLNYLLEPVDPETIFVCELSSYQLDDIQYSPNISVIVSLFPDHINFHGNIGNYYESKHNIIKHAKAEDYYVYNPQFELLDQWALEANCQTIPFIRYLPEEIQEVPLIGEHNMSNLRGAITVAELFDIENEDIAEAVRTFIPLKHRLEKVGEFKDILFFDDAISTTPESTIAAIEALPPIGTIMLGGQNRGYDFTELAQMILLKNISNIILFPDSGEDILESLLLITADLPTILHTDSMEAAVKFAYENTPTHTICLLSTASPSYSLWKNFEEKGDQFQQYVIAYGKN